MKQLFRYSLTLSRSNFPNNFIMHGHYFLTANIGCLIVHVQHCFLTIPTDPITLSAQSNQSTCSYNSLLPCPPLPRILSNKSLWSHHTNSNLPPLGKTKLCLWDPVGSGWTESFECFSEAKVLQKSFQKPPLCSNLGIFSPGHSGLDKAPVTGMEHTLPQYIINNPYTVNTLV